jgi:hypothetical protein
MALTWSPIKLVEDLTADHVPAKFPRHIAPLCDRASQEGFRQTLGQAFLRGRAAEQA